MRVTKIHTLLVNERRKKTDNNAKDTFSYVAAISIAQNRKLKGEKKSNQIGLKGKIRSIFMNFMIRFFFSLPHHFSSVWWSHIISTVSMHAFFFLSLFQCDVFILSTKQQKLFYSNIFGHFGRFTGNFVFVLLFQLRTIWHLGNNNNKKSYICFDAKSTKWIETVSMFFFSISVIGQSGWLVRLVHLDFLRLVVLLHSIWELLFFYIYIEIFIISILCDFLFGFSFDFDFSFFYWSFTFQQKKTLQTRDTWTINSFDFGQLFSSMSDCVQSEKKRVL